MRNYQRKIKDLNFPIIILGASILTLLTSITLRVTGYTWFWVFLFGIGFFPLFINAFIDLHIRSLLVLLTNISFFIYCVLLPVGFYFAYYTVDMFIRTLLLSCGWAIFLIFLARFSQGLGRGDIRLFFVLSLYTGVYVYTNIFWGIFLSFFLSVIIFFTLKIFNLQIRNLPMAPCIILAFIGSLFLSSPTFKLI